MQSTPPIAQDGFFLDAMHEFPDFLSLSLCPPSVLHPSLRFQGQTDFLHAARGPRLDAN